MQYYTLKLKEGTIRGLRFEQVVSRMKGLMDLGFVVVDIGFDREASDPPREPTVIRERLYVCAFPGCPFESERLTNVKRHRARAHRVTPIKVER